MSSSLPKSGPAAPGRASRTPELDAALLASFQKDPQRFQRATRRELLVAILLFALGVLIAWLGAFVITDRQGGLTGRASPWGWSHGPSGSGGPRTGRP